MSNADNFSIVNRGIDSEGGGGGGYIPLEL